MKKMLMLSLVIYPLICVLMLALGISVILNDGYNRVMREHLGDKDNYYTFDVAFLSYAQREDRIYLYVTVDDGSTIDPSAESDETRVLQLVGKNCSAIGEILANAEICEGDKITVKCSAWIYMDSPFYYVAEIKVQDKVYLSFEDGFQNIVKYMDDNKSFL